MISVIRINTANRTLQVINKDWSRLSIDTNSEKAVGGKKKKNTLNMTTIES